MCNTALVNLDLRNDVKPVFLRPFPVMRVKEAMLRKKVEKIVDLRALENLNESNWVAPSFSWPKSKSNWVRFLSDFRNLNRQCKHKSDPIQKIHGMLLQLEGFKYITSLDLYMWYYHKCLRRNSSNLCTIILPWGKYRYKCLPIGVRNSP